MHTWNQCPLAFSNINKTFLKKKVVSGLLQPLLGSPGLRGPETRNSWRRGFFFMLNLCFLFQLLTLTLHCFPHMSQCSPSGKGLIRISRCHDLPPLSANNVCTCATVLLCSFGDRLLQWQGEWQELEPSRQDTESRNIPFPPGPKSPPFS